MTNMKQLYDASNDSSRHSLTWQGVQVLVGKERFFWPVSRNPSNEEDDVFWYTLEGHTCSFFSFLFLYSILWFISSFFFF